MVVMYMLCIVCSLASLNNYLVINLLQEYNKLESVAVFFLKPKGSLSYMIQNINVLWHYQIHNKCSDLL